VSDLEASGDCLGIVGLSQIQLNTANKERRATK
jgi:hypothetical protein